MLRKPIPVRRFQTGESADHSRIQDRRSHSRFTCCGSAFEITSGTPKINRVPYKLPEPIVSTLTPNPTPEAHALPSAEERPRDRGIRDVCGLPGRGRRPHAVQCPTMQWCQMKGVKVEGSAMVRALRGSDCHYP
jgi:hypothetical protein